MEKYQELLKLARESIESEITPKELKVDEKLKKKYSEKKACFVTLTIAGKLRGCIGSLEPRQELWKDVIENAKNAAFFDSRFLKLTLNELAKIKIEISVLSIPRKISYKNPEELKKKIKGKGVVLKKDWNSATYLPLVWKELQDKNEFLNFLCKKAGLSGDVWKMEKLEVYTYRSNSVIEN